ncbi:thiol reductant ABC exporter subunit CydD [Pseudofrankia sp. DC12]|uniref:thiol reductant ABC exporter subunit CydD n=1 Tax=Pseudofrankia sp. DC12 TaxID=683315 RepID=UPI00069859CD|nr:thiol reductant ABC exporter subunit CydD [Pseudofrankia sp. DC12]
MKPVDPRLLRAVPRLRGYLGRLVVLTAVSTSLLLVQATFLVDAVVRGSSGRLGPGALAGTLGAFVGAVAARAGVGWLIARDGERTAPRVIADLRARALEATVARAAHAQPVPGAGRLAPVMGAGLDGAETYLTRFLPALMTVAVVPPVILAVLAWTDLTSAVILGLTLPLVPVFMVLVGLATRKRAEQRLAVLTRLSQHFLDVAGGLVTLRVFGRARAQVETIRRVSAAYRVETMASLRMAFASSLVMELLATLSVALVAVSVGLRLVDGSVGFSAALLVVMLAPEVHAPLRQVGAQFHATMAGLTATREALDLIDAAPSVPSVPQAAPSTDPAPVQAAGPVEVRLVDIGLHRATAAEPTLRALSLTLRPGEITALVGPSGAGKSSVLDVLRAAVRPSAGRVLVDGVDVSTMAPSVWRDRVTWLPQRPHALAAGATELLRAGRVATVADEVALGLPRGRSASAPGEAGAVAVVAAAMAAAGAPEPGKPLGEDGRALSAGELRRTALARTLARQAPLVLLDEPSESVDPATEAHVARAVAGMRGRATVLVVAHSAALTEMADRVITLREGRVVADEPGRRPAAGDADSLEPDHPRPHHEAVTGVLADGPRPVPDASRPGGPSGKTVQLPAAPASGPRVVSGRPGRAGPRRPGRAITRDSPLAGLLSGQGWVRLGLGVAAGAGATLAGSGLTATAAWLISRASAHPPVLTLMVATVAVRAFGLARPALRYGERLLTHDAALRGLAGLRAAVFGHLTTLSPAALAARHRGDLLRRVTVDVDGLAEALPRAIAPLAVAALAAVGVTGVLAVLATPATAALIAAGLTLAGLAAALGAATARTARRAVNRGRGDRDAAVVALVERLDEAVAFDVAAGSLDALRRFDLDLVRAATARRRSAAWAGPAQALTAGLCTAAVTAAGIGAVHAGALHWELLAVLALLTPVIFELTSGLRDAFTAVGDARDAAIRVLDVLGPDLDSHAATDALVAQPPDPPTPRADPAAPLDRACVAAGLPDGPLGVRLTGVRAGYRGTPAAKVLEAVDLRIPAGGRVALTGASGSGKSTLASLLLRLAEPSAGQIEFGNAAGWVDVRDLPEQQLRGAVAALTQDAHLFDATIRENLRLARPNAPETALVAVLGQVGLTEWLTTLPLGLDSRVGVDGARMSGGQRQRLLLARVLLADARVLVIDEPTAHLDAATERHILDVLLGLPANRTIVIITHRATGLDRMDAVYRLAGGRLTSLSTGPSRRPEPSRTTVLDPEERTASRCQEGWLTGEDGRHWSGHNDGGVLEVGSIPAR